MAIRQVQRRFVPWWRLGMVLVAVAVLVRVALGVWDNFGPARAASGSVPAAAQTDAATQTSEGGQVTVKATWQGLDAGPVFMIVMDTHAVDLDGYDLTQSAVLRTAQGQEVRPTGWDAPKGGHHREGTLTFPSTAPDGSALLPAGTKSVELVIRDVAGVPERTFQWTR